MLNASEVPSSGKKMFSEPFSPGGYPSRLVQVIDLGLHPQTDLVTGEAKEPKHIIRAVYETVDEFMKDEDGNDIENKPRWIAEEFPLHSLNSDMAKSTKRYMVLDPTNEFGGDWEKVLGLPCIVNIVNNPGKGKHKGKVFDKIDSTAPIREREAKKMPELQNNPKVFSTSEPDVEVFLSLPEFVQNKIKEALNFPGSPLEEALGDRKGRVEDDGPSEVKADNADGEDW